MSAKAQMEPLVVHVFPHSLVSFGRSMLRPAIRSLRCAIGRPLIVATTVRQCSHLSAAPRLNPVASLPPPLWQTVDHFILPTRSSSEKHVIMDKLPTKPIFAPEHSIISLSYSLPPAPSKSSEMHAGLRILRIYRPVKRNWKRMKRHKMNKHKRKKFRKKYAALIKRVKMRREVKKEKLFRAELLAQIKEAEQFDAGTYVKKMLETIDKKPQQESLWERQERFLRLKRMYRTNVDLFRPKFDDPVD